MKILKNWGGWAHKTHIFFRKWRLFLKIKNFESSLIGYPDEIPLNAVEPEPVPTGVLNPNASEANYKPKQRTYRETKLKLLLLVFSVGFLPRTL